MFYLESFLRASEAALLTRLRCSAHGYMHRNILNKLGPETTVYVYTNSKMAAAIHDANELKMFAWDNEDM